MVLSVEMLRPLTAHLGVNMRVFDHLQPLTLLFIQPSNTSIINESSIQRATLALVPTTTVLSTTERSRSTLHMHLTPSHPFLLIRFAPSQHRRRSLSDQCSTPAPPTPQLASQSSMTSHLFSIRTGTASWNLYPDSSVPVGNGDMVRNRTQTRLA